MPHTDPDWRLNCPKCSRKLVYISSRGTGPENVTHVYECPEHGRWIVPPDTDLRREPTPVH